MGHRGGGVGHRGGGVGYWGYWGVSPGQKITRLAAPLPPLNNYEEGVMGYSAREAPLPIYNHSLQPNQAYTHIITCVRGPGGAIPHQEIGEILGNSQKNVFAYMGDGRL